MAEEKKKSFPKIPRANWFALRDRFKQKPPSEVTVSYLSSVLGITEPSAANLIPPLKALGLVGQDNKLTDLAFEWRDDATYADACEKMLEATYPVEVREILSRVYCADTGCSKVVFQASSHRRISRDEYCINVLTAA